MKRRQVLAGAASLATVAVAGCSANPLGSSGPNCSEVPFDYDWEATPYLSTSGNPVIILTGTIISRSDDCSMEALEVTVDAVDDSGEVVLTKSQVVRQIGPRDEETFVFKFLPSQDEASRINDYDLSTRRLGD